MPALSEPQFSEQPFPARRETARAAEPQVTRGPAYWIRTERLVVRCWEPTDAPLLKLAVDDDLARLAPWMAWSAEDTREIESKIDLLRRFRGQFDLGEDFAYGIFDPLESAILGGCGLHVYVEQPSREIGYWVASEHRRLGYATEAAAALVRVAFAVDRVRYVEIRCDPHNQASTGVARKLGFSRVWDAPLRSRNSPPTPNLGIWRLYSVDYRRSPIAEMEIEAFDAVGRRLV
jgi:RimJ/RimL family protein N-acetyltransferase